MWFLAPVGFKPYKYYLYRAHLTFTLSKLAKYTLTENNMFVVRIPYKRNRHKQQKSAV